MFKLEKKVGYPLKLYSNVYWVKGNCQIDIDYQCLIKLDLFLHYFHLKLFFRKYSSHNIFNDFKDKNNKKKPYSFVYLKSQMNLWLHITKAFKRNFQHFNLFKCQYYFYLKLFKSSNHFLGILVFIVLYSGTCHSCFAVAQEMQANTH